MSVFRYLEFPNGVVVNDSMEIFISDNRAHCVKVFDYHGNYLRQIGGEGVSNFPIGVGLTASGEICIADNHNNFNLTVFSQAGQLLGALESKVKHAQCFDVALMKDGSIVLASKDYRLHPPLREGDKLNVFSLEKPFTHFSSGSSSRWTHSSSSSNYALFDSDFSHHHIELLGHRRP